MPTDYSIERIVIPQTSLLVTQRLGKTLYRDKPEPSNAVIEWSAAKLAAMLKLVDVALIARFRAVNPQIIATENDFDRGVDVNWVWLRKLLEGWRDAYGHSGLAALPPEIQEYVDLPKLRRRSELAGKLHDRLFGAEGTNWVMSNWMVQAETMATILGLIKSDDLGEDLAEVVGEELPRLLVGVQRHYEDVVSTRMSRDQRPADDFTKLKAKLRWQLDHYKSAVETLRDPDEPETFEVVARALRSLTLLSKRMRAGVSAKELNELVDDELVALDLEYDPELDPEAPEPPAMLEQAADDEG